MDTSKTEEDPLKETLEEFQENATSESDSIKSNGNNLPEANINNNKKTESDHENKEIPQEEDEYYLETQSDSSSTEIEGEKIDEETQKPLRKNLELIKLYCRNTFNQENDARWRRLNYESSFCTLDCLIAPLEDRLVSSVKNQSNKRIVFLWDRQNNGFQRDPFSDDRIGKIVSSNKVFETLQKCDKLMKQFISKYDKIFGTLLLIMRYIWYILGVGSFFFLLGQILQVILLATNSRKGRNQKKDVARDYDFEDYLWIFFSIYIFALFSNVIGFFIVDYLRRKLHFGARANHINNYLLEENKDYYQNYWLTFNVSPCSMAIILSFDRKLIGPLLYWNFEKVTTGLDQMSIEKAIIIYYGTNNKENLPNYIKNLSKSQLESIETEGIQEATEDGSKSSETEDISDLTEDSQDLNQSDFDSKEGLDKDMESGNINKVNEESSNSDGYIEIESDEEKEQQNKKEVQIYEEEIINERSDQKQFESSDKIIQEVVDHDKKFK